MEEDDKEDEGVQAVAMTPSSSPPTPSSPLPISVGPGNSKYYLSSSSASPPFSPPTSGRNSAENLPLIAAEKPVHRPSAFSLDTPSPDPNSSSPSQGSNCLKDLLEWFVLRCSSCCSWEPTPSISSRPHQS